MLSSNNSIDFLKSFSKHLGKLEKAKSDNHFHDSDLEEERTPSKTTFSKSISSKTSSKKEQNFKVVVRVRPPLPREIDAHAGFAPITHIAKNNK